MSHSRRREQHQDPRRLLAAILKAVQRATRHEHERAGRRARDLGIDAEPQITFEHVSGAIGNRTEAWRVALDWGWIWWR
jgi:hypothetical protein